MKYFSHTGHQVCKILNTVTHTTQQQSILPTQAMIHGGSHRMVTEAEVPHQCWWCWFIGSLPMIKRMKVMQDWVSPCTHPTLTDYLQTIWAHPTTQLAFLTGLLSYLALPILMLPLQHIIKKSAQAPQCPMLWYCTQWRTESSSCLLCSCAFHMLWRIRHWQSQTKLLQLRMHAQQKGCRN